MRLYVGDVISNAPCTRLHSHWRVCDIEDQVDDDYATVDIECDWDSQGTRQGDIVSDYTITLPIPNDSWEFVSRKSGVAKVKPKLVCPNCGNDKLVPDNAHDKLHDHRYHCHRCGQTNISPATGKMMNGGSMVEEEVGKIKNRKVVRETTPEDELKAARHEILRQIFSD